MSLEQLQRNLEFLGRHDVRRLLTDLYQRSGAEENIMSDFQTDVQRLSDDVAIDKAAIAKVGTLVQQNTQTITDLKGEIVTLQGQSVDTTNLEALLGQLEDNNNTLQGIVPADPTASASTQTGTSDTSNGGSAASDGSASSASDGSATAADTTAAGTGATASGTTTDAPDTESTATGTLSGA